MVDFKLCIVLSGFILFTRAHSRENVNLGDLSDVWPPPLNDETSPPEYDLEKRAHKPQGWSPWSDWSTCSRSCDGGVQTKLRRCHSSNGCNGESMRYKICNMQQCPDEQDFRAHQCAAYDDVPYDGALFKWSPHYDYSEPCALTCRGRPTHLSDENVEQNYDEFEDEPYVVVQLATRVQDGTRCRSGSLDMCIQGKCQSIETLTTQSDAVTIHPEKVGCDLEIGSSKQVDLCGVCGGDGSSCAQPIYHWDIAPMSLCSLTCGGGHKMGRPICRDRITGGDVDETLCDAASRPDPVVIDCNSHICPPKWIPKKWAPCNKVCGGGERRRSVYCAVEIDGLRTKVHDKACKAVKPQIEEPCNNHECPIWTTTEWSGCSVSCGTGIQVRNVECETVDGYLSTHCDPTTKPEAIQACSTGMACTRENLEDLNDVNDSNDNMFGDQPHKNHQQYNGQSRMENYKDSRYQPDMPTFMLENEWSSCSVTCGDGVRRKKYRCKVFLVFTKVLSTFNDSMCTGPKPNDIVERCIAEPCMLAYSYEDSYPKDTFRQVNENFKVAAAVPGKTYSWREQGYTSCSASCLGGVEDLIINCVRDDTEKVVSPFLCAPETKPEARIRTCNDRPCPPRWNVSEYSACSKSCGIGIKTREVLCIHEVTRGGENTMIVPHNMCPQPPPADRQYCNVLDCPVRWETSEWTKCSKSCGGGIKERKVACKQIMAQEHKVERPAALCPPTKPSDKKPCNTKPCASENQRPVIAINNSTYIQHDDTKSKVTLKIGGAATVFYGTQIKIKCPVKKFDRTKIRWSKDYKFLNKTKKYKISKKGALRILHVVFRDSGVYTCHAGLNAADLRLTVVAKTGSPMLNPESEDYERHMDVSDIDTFSDYTKQEIDRSTFLVFANNQSHEHTTSRSKQESRKTKARTKSGERSGLNQNKMETKEPSHFHSQMTMTDIEPTPTSSSSRIKSFPIFRHFNFIFKNHIRQLSIYLVSIFNVLLLIL